MNSIKFTIRKEFFKKITWNFILRLGMESNSIILSLLDTVNNVSNSNLYNWRYYFKSRNKEPSLADGKVACIMCTWMEEKMVPLALESSKDFVSRYIVVDKDGKTVPVIESYRDKWGLDMEIYIKPKLSLRESRAFALTKIVEPWVLIQDGDEVFHTDGPNSIYGLRRFLDRPHILLMTTMTRLQGNLLYTNSINPRQTAHAFPRQAAHAFLYHNNGTLRAPRKNQDLPSMAGWKIYLKKPYKFNCVIKSPYRIFLRKFWDEWCLFSDMYLKYPNIEEYVTEELGINVEIEAEKWYKIYLKNLIPYDEKRWGYYPKVIRKYIRRARK